MAQKRRIVYTNRPWEATGICCGCRLCELYCSLQANGTFNPHRSRVRVVEMATGIDIPVTCQQCQDPVCQTACDFDAVVFDPKLKIVVVNEENCTSCQACVGACPYGIITMDPVSNKAIKCDLCGDSEPACVEICPSRVLEALDDLAVAEFNRRRYAGLLAVDDELLRAMPGGEDPVMKKLEKKG